MNLLDENELHANSTEPMLNSKGMYYLGGIRTWAKILSIIGFVFLGVMAILMLVVGMAEKGLAGIFGVLVLFAFVFGLYFYPIWTLFKFSTNTKKALQNQSADDLTEALRNLKNHYMVIGILMLIGVVMYGFTLLWIFLLGGIGMLGALG